MREPSYLDEDTLKEILMYAYTLETENINVKELIDIIKNKILSKSRKSSVVE